MNPEFTFGGVFIAEGPMTACIALAIALVIHRVLVLLRFYRFVWHPVLFDTALFMLVWGVIVLTPIPLAQGLLP